VPDDPTNLRVLFASVERSDKDVFGVPAKEMNGQPLEEGESVPAENTVVAIPATDLFPSTDWSPTDFFDAGRPAPLAGATFGMSILSTPNASVADQSANPLVDKSTKSLLQREETRQMLRRAGVSDADDVEWAQGPDPFYREGKDQDHVSNLLGEETEIESFSGVVSGDVGPWGVAIHVARATPDDHVIAAGVQRWPTGTGKAAAKKGDTTLFVPGEDVSWLTDMIGRLTVEYREGKDP
jgi:hypothetical protein